MNKPIPRNEIRQGAAQHLVTEIVMHCAATRVDWMADRPFTEQVAAIRRWHTQPPPNGNGWRDIGYHWVVSRTGEILPGRAMTVIGAHVAGRNTGTVGICLIGGHGSSENDRFLRNFTLDQDRAARRLIQQISAATPISKISGHNEYARKACPGFNVTEWLRGQM